MCPSKYDDLSFDCFRFSPALPVPNRLRELTKWHLVLKCLFLAILFSFSFLATSLLKDKHGTKRLTFDDKAITLKQKIVVEVWITSSSGSTQHLSSVQIFIFQLISPLVKFSYVIIHSALIYTVMGTLRSRKRAKAAQNSPNAPFLCRAGATTADQPAWINGIVSNIKKSQLMLTKRATRLDVSQGHQTWYHSIC